MARRLALLEGLSLVAVATNMLLFLAHPVLVTWYDIMLLVGKAVALSLCCVVSFYYNDLYDLRVVRNVGEFTARLLQAFGTAFILLAGFYSVFPKANIGPGPFASSILMIAGLLLPLRFVSYSIMRSRTFVDRILILGTSPLARKIVEEIETQPNCGYVVAGIVDDGSAPTAEGVWHFDRYPRLAPMQDLDRFVEELKPDRLIVALADRRGRLPVSQLLNARMRRIFVEEGVELYERLTGKLAIESMNPSALIFAKSFMKSNLDLAFGRALSLAVSLVGLVLTAPLMVALAVLVKLESRGPVLFIQDRVGAFGKHFRLIKFRTMHAASGETETSFWVRDNNDRITRVGKWLRRFRMDELPQFVNILLGDMNLVGPRPHPVSNYELFVKNIPYYTLRASVRPGVTGWAQIRYGYANDLHEETEKMRFDLYYIKHLTFWVDLRILFDTAKIVAFGGGTEALDEANRERRVRTTHGTNGHVATPVNGHAHVPVVTAAPARVAPRAQEPAR